MKGLQNNATINVGHCTIASKINGTTNGVRLSQKLQLTTTRAR